MHGMSREVGHPVNLRDWTALDFSNAYVRYRSVLVRFARKHVQTSEEAEDIVQEAFLYLLTALPEMDSEVGVLRFLKWKTAMLATDGHRYNSRRMTQPLPSEDIIGDESLNPADELELAEDSAVIRLALSRLDERQQRALVLSVIQGATSEEAARQLGLNANGFRQLLFRAKRSFRISLESEAERRGIATSQLLTGKASKLFTFTASLFTVLAIGAFVWTPSNPDDLDSKLTAQDSSNTQVDFLQKETGVGSVDLSDSTLPPAGTPATENGSDPISTRLDFESQNKSDAGSVISQNAKEAGPRVAVEQPGRSLESENLLLSELRPRLEQAVLRRVESAQLEIETGSLLSVVTDYGLSAHLGMDLNESPKVQYIYFSIDTSQGQVHAVPQVALQKIEQGAGDIQVVHYAGTDLIVGDFEGHLSFASADLTELLPGGFLVSITIDGGVPTIATLETFLKDSAPEA